MKSVIFPRDNKLIADDLIVCIQCNTGYITLSHLEVTGAFLKGTVHGSNLGTKSLTKVLKACADRKSFLRKCTLGTAIYDLQEQLSHSGVNCVTNKVCVQRLQNGSVPAESLLP